MKTIITAMLRPDVLRGMNGQIDTCASAFTLNRYDEAMVQ